MTKSKSVVVEPDRTNKAAGQSRRNNAEDVREHDQHCQHGLRQHLPRIELEKPEMKMPSASQALKIELSGR